MSKDGYKQNNMQEQINDSNIFAVKRKREGPDF